MIEEGTVTQIDGKIAKVAVERKSACDRCHARDFCQMIEANRLVVSAVNEAGARVGDRVELEVPDAAGLAASSLIYFVPTVLFIAGAVVGTSLFGSALAGALVGIAGVAAGYGFAAYAWKKRWQKRGQPRVISILD